MVTIPKKFVFVEIPDKSTNGIILGLDGVKTRLGNDHPDWELHYLNEVEGVNILRDHFPNLAMIWDKIPTRKSKENVIRYAWLSLNGGVSIETSITLNKPIDNLFYTDAEIYLLKDSSVKYGISTEIMASKRGAIFWKDVLSEVESRIANKPWWLKGDYFNDRYLTGEDMLMDVAEKTSTIYSIIPPLSITNQNITALNTNKGYTNGVYSCYVSYKDNIIIILVIIIFILLMIILVMSLKSSKYIDSFKYSNGSTQPTYLRQTGQIPAYQYI
jgi:hypothetical protein